MNITVNHIDNKDAKAWDGYVKNHPKATLYHLSGWREVIQNTYQHPTYYLMAKSTKNYAITGVLPLVHLKHFLFGNALVSMPFFDHGGLLASNHATEKALLETALTLMDRLKAKTIELRHANRPLVLFQKGSSDLLKALVSVNTPKNQVGKLRETVKTHKVSMILELPDSPKTLMKSFKSKLRSQIKKPLKEGLVPKIGGLDLLDDFYRVFTINMRDLGSPVHSINMIKNVVQQFPDRTRIVIVYRKNTPVACSLVVGFKSTLSNPWASSLRKYNRLSPNMLLYWTMLEYASSNVYQFFDFGRSTPNEGTYRFKAQWGAKPKVLHWHYLKWEKKNKNIDSENNKNNLAILIWKRLPLSLTNLLGPQIRKHISL